MTQRRKRREFSEDFKHQMVSLYNAGKPQVEIYKEYDLTPSTLARWIRTINETGSSKAKDNRSPLEKELLEAQKELRQLRMENDLLKQAALILGRK